MNNNFDAITARIPLYFVAISEMEKGRKCDHVSRVERSKGYKVLICKRCPAQIAITSLLPTRVLCVMGPTHVAMGTTDTRVRPGGQILSKTSVIGPMAEPGHGRQRQTSSGNRNLD